MLARPHWNGHCSPGQLHKSPDVPPQRRFAHRYRKCSYVFEALRPTRNVLEENRCRHFLQKSPEVSVLVLRHLGGVFPLADLTPMASLQPIYPHFITKPCSILLFNHASLRQCRFRRHVFEGPRLQQHQPRSADGAAAADRGEHREDKGEASPPLSPPSGLASGANVRLCLRRCPRPPPTS